MCNGAVEPFVRFGTLVCGSAETALLLPLGPKLSVRVSFVVSFARLRTRSNVKFKLGVKRVPKLRTRVLFEKTSEYSSEYEYFTDNTKQCTAHTLVTLNVLHLMHM